MTCPILPPTRLGDGQFQFMLHGGPGTNYWVQVSSDLKTWTNFTTVTLTNGVVGLFRCSGNIATCPASPYDPST